MPITKEQLEKEIAQLRAMLKQAEANGNAVSGALQFAERLLASLDSQEAPPSA